MKALVFDFQDDGGTAIPAPNFLILINLCII